MLPRRLPGRVAPFARQTALSRADPVVQPGSSDAAQGPDPVDVRPIVMGQIDMFGGAQFRIEGRQLGEVRDERDCLGPTAPRIDAADPDPTLRRPLETDPGLDDRVDFPAAFGPTRAVIRPQPISMVTSERANVPRSYRLVSPSATKAGPRCASTRLDFMHK